MNRLLSVLLLATAASRFLALGPEYVRWPRRLRSISASTSRRLRTVRTSCCACGVPTPIRVRPCSSTSAHRAINIRGEVVIRPGEEQTTTTTLARSADDAERPHRCRAHERRRRRHRHPRWRPHRAPAEPRYARAHRPDAAVY